jgi:hypothetical protein
MNICLSFSQRDRLKFFYLSPGLVKVCLRYLALVPPPYVSQFFYFCYIILACTFLFKLIIHNSMYLYEWEQVPSSLVRVYALLWIRVWEGKLLHHVIFIIIIITLDPSFTPAFVIMRVLLGLWRKIKVYSTMQSVVRVLKLKELRKSKLVYFSLLRSELYVHFLWREPLHSSVID